MFVDELGGLSNGVQQNGEGIETANHAAQLNATDEIDGDADILFAHLIQKDVLKV